MLVAIQVLFMILLFGILSHMFLLISYLSLVFDLLPIVQDVFCFEARPNFFSRDNLIAVVKRVLRGEDASCHTCKLLLEVSL